MRRFALRAVLIALVPVSVVAAPGATAKPPDIPWGCELLNNTHCHCVSPSGLRDCMIID